MINDAYMIHLLAVTNNLALRERELTTEEKLYYIQNMALVQRWNAFLEMTVDNAINGLTDSESTEDPEPPETGVDVGG